MSQNRHNGRMHKMYCHWHSTPCPVLLISTHPPPCQCCPYPSRTSSCLPCIVLVLRVCQISVPLIGEQTSSCPCDTSARPATAIPTLKRRRQHTSMALLATMIRCVPYACVTYTGSKARQNWNLRLKVTRRRRLQLCLYALENKLWKQWSHRLCFKPEQEVTQGLV